MKRTQRLSQQWGSSETARLGDSRLLTNLRDRDIIISLGSEVIDLSYREPTKEVLSTNVAFRYFILSIT